MNSKIKYTFDSFILRFLLLLLRWGIFHISYMCMMFPLSFSMGTLKGIMSQLLTSVTSDFKHILLMVWSLSFLQTGISPCFHFLHMSGKNLFFFIISLLWFGYQSRFFLATICPQLVKFGKFTSCANSLNKWVPWRWKTIKCSSHKLYIIHRVSNSF